MISNRQGGRRRGRGGQRPQNPGGRPDSNRQDNRQRGNATQLLEKYKNMARDAQLSGDRVQMEYYLQFADHYFRVLNESRARFEEQRRQRGDDGDESDGDEDSEASDDQDNDEERQEEQRPQRPQRPQRRERGERNRRSAGEDGGSDERKAGNGADRSNGSGERIALEALPPAIRRDDEEQAGAAEEEAPKPRRRARRPKAGDGDGEMAPAA